MGEPSFQGKEREGKGREWNGRDLKLWVMIIGA
jgi:hypothetical protein